MWVRGGVWGVVAALRRSDCGDPGRSQDRRDLCADRPGLYPDERIGFVLADGGGGGDHHRVVALAGGFYGAVVDIEDEGIAAQPGTPLPVRHDDIYVIYPGIRQPRGGGSGIAM